MSQGTPRKFSEKIAIMQRKQNEDEDAFAKVMRDVRTITSNDPVPVQQQLAPGQWNRPGGSLPNVHQMAQQQQQPMPWGYWDPSQPQRGRSPGGGHQYHPYHKPRSQERVPPLHYHIPYPQGQYPPQHLQPPDSWNTFCRARSDPAIHSHTQMHSMHPGMSMPPAYPGTIHQMQMMAPGGPGLHQMHNMQSGLQNNMHNNDPHNMQMNLQNMQPGPSMQGSPQNQIGSPMQGMSPVASPTQTLQSNMVGSPMGQGMNSPMGGSCVGSPMQSMTPQQMGSPVSPLEDHRLMELSPPGVMMDPDASPVGSLPNMTSLPQQNQNAVPGPSCYHPTVGQRHSTGCVRLVPILSQESRSAPTSPQQNTEQSTASGWPPNRHFSFSNSPEGIDIPNIVLTGADGGTGDLDCFQDLQDLHLDVTDMQMLCNGNPDPQCETQLLH